jgi:PAS domain S-box-containing protein
MGNLETSTDKLKVAIDTLQDIFILFDLQGNLLNWNRRGNDVTGYTDEEVASLNINKFFKPEHFTRVIATISRGLEEGFASVEMDLVCKDGRCVPYEFYGTPLRNEAGTALGITAIGRDITDRKRLIEKEREASAALAASAEAEKHSRKLQDLIMIASHELRHPATVFKGYANLLLDRMDRMDQQTIQDALRAISDSADRLARLVSGLFETAVIEQEQMSLKPRSVLPSDILKPWTAEGGDRDYAAVRVLTSETPERPIVADPEKIARVIEILVENALQYSPDGSPVELAFEQNVGETVFTVSDRGPGIPQEDSTNVFDRFYQVGNPEHHSLPGIGLGLYIARRVINAHRGSIKVSTRDGGGSVFSFTLPNSPG